MIKNTDITKDLPAQKWNFTLYVCGESPRAINTYMNLKRVCDERLDGQYKIRVIDLVKNPTLAFTNNITACPTLIKETPSPRRVVIGDLSKTEVLLAKLEFPTVPLVSELSKGAKSVSVSDVNYVNSSLKEIFGSLSEVKYIQFPE